jgi:hypothetical protein
VASTGSVHNNEIANITGGLGFAWNQARDQHFLDWGYPSGTPYNGNKLVLTTAEERYETTFGGSPAQNSIGSAQTPGFSGGPWVIGFSGQNAFINSVNSYYFTGGPNGDEYGRQIQGPYQDTAACGFWRFWTGFSGTC